MTELEADYLVIGSGAMGMAFTDTLLSESNATVVMVDRHHQPGGHWNVAYPHVRLHQPSAFYGVNSKHLGSDRVDDSGWNKGLFELATNSEVVAYFDQVMQHTFLSSGRVQYFPSCEYVGDGSFHSLVSDETYRVRAKKIVNAAYMNVTVPSMRPPAFDLAQGVACEPPNSLAKLQGGFNEYMVIGCGKTGIDACLFLLKNNVDPNRIRWIAPRDAWLLDRANIQPGHLFAQSIGRLVVQQMQDMAAASSIADLFERLEASGALLRIDPTVQPTMYRCGTVTKAEVEQLRRITNIVRKGRVNAIDIDTVYLEHGTEPTNPATLHIDCTADGLERRPVLPVFQDDNITLQSVRTCQQVFSGAFVAHVECAYTDEQEKNELCTPVPHPNSDTDYLRSALGNAVNAARWSEDAQLQAWLKDARLDGFSDRATSEPDLSNPEVVQKIEDMGKLARASTERLRALLTEV